MELSKEIRTLLLIAETAVKFIIKEGKYPAFEAWVKETKPQLFAKIADLAARKKEET